MLRSTPALLAGLGLLSAGALACNRSEPEKGGPAASASAAVVAAPAPHGDHGLAPPEPSPKPKIANQWGKAVGFKAPESVLHDEKNDVYLVSNVDGKPLEADGKGFISKVAPVGQGVELKWIEGGKKGAVLNAPKGMALTDDTLWVADIDTVRTFDRNTGAPTGEVKVPGATFLNDVAVGTDGRVLVTDMGQRAAKGGGTEPSGTDAIYAIGKDRKLSVIVKAKTLGGPNGILGYGDQKIHIVTMTSGELCSFDAKGEKENSQRLPRGGLDGIAFGREDYFISSWDASAIYRGKVGHSFELFADDLKSPADLMFDKKRNRLVIPLMNEDEVRAYETP